MSWPVNFFFISQSSLVFLVLNIGTQSAHELFFVIGELFTVMICSSFLGCDVQQERNWEVMNLHTMLHR